MHTSSHNFLANILLYHKFICIYVCAACFKSFLTFYNLLKFLLLKIFDSTVDKNVNFKDINYYGQITIIFRKCVISFSSNLQAGDDVLIH